MTFATRTEVYLQCRKLLAKLPQDGAEHVKHASFQYVTYDGQFQMIWRKLTKSRAAQLGQDSRLFVLEESKHPLVAHDREQYV